VARSDTERTAAVRRLRFSPLLTPVAFAIPTTRAASRHRII